MGEVMNNSSDFSVVLDLNCFRLSEMSVKLVDGSIVVVEAKHGERADEEFGVISRHFLHKYRLPSDIDPGSVTSDLSNKGVLTITAKKKRKFSASEHTNSEEILMDLENYDETRYIIDNYEHPDPEIFYTLTRVAGKNCPDFLFEQLESGCSCKNNECTVENNCSCLKTGPNYKLFNSTQVLKKEKFGNVPIFECNFRFRCFGNLLRLWNETGEQKQKPILCQNRCVQFGPSADLEIFTTSTKGLGLKTNRKIRFGTFICEYAGEVIDVEEAKRRQARRFVENKMNFIFILTENFCDSDKFITCVDPTNIGNIGRYINHSCEPNSSIVPIRVNNMAPLLCVFAIRDIEEGEEICFDYSGSEEYGVVEEKNRKPCFCGAEMCKKWLPFQIM